MLTDIHIKNFTIVSELHLELKLGLNVISGETGAGKSILVDAMQLALGGRSDSKTIRQGATRGEITLRFDINHSPRVQTWLEEHNFSSEHECLVTRVIQQDGPSKSYLNGKPIPLGLIKQLARDLVTVQGQHQSHTLLHRQQQGHLVDTYAKNTTLIDDIQTLYQQWRTNEIELEQLQVMSAQRIEQLSFLNYQIEELIALNLEDNELETLHQEHNRLHNAKELITKLNQAIDLCCENEAHSSSLLLNQAINQLETVAETDPQITEIVQLLNTAAIHINEAKDALFYYRNSLNLSPERLQQVESRLSIIHDIARKHHCDAEALPMILQSLQHKAEKLQHCEKAINQLHDEQQIIKQRYQKIADKLTEKRKKAASIINKQISSDMQTLGMKGGEFEIRFNLQENQLSPTGNETIVFWVKTNPGQKMEPLSKVVSGGELSRISLAIQNMIAEQTSVPTFIFDEVDVGIGGETAEIVGKLLQNFANNRQVFCITHLPQVAACGDNHYQVIKTSSKHTTTTDIQLLDKRARINELARMISGSKISQQTLKHAEQLLTSDN